MKVSVPRNTSNDPDRRVDLGSTRYRKTEAEPTRGARARRPALVVTLILAYIGLTAAPASAEYKDIYQRSFSGSGALHNPIALAFDQTSGDVYTSDVSADLIDKLDPASGELVKGYGTDGQINGSATPAGAFSEPWGLAVEQTTGDLYVANFGYGVVDKFNPSGEPVTSFGTDGQISGAATPQGYFGDITLTVDPTNQDLYVADDAHSVIDVYTAGGEYLRQFSTDAATSPIGVAVDTSGYIYVVGEGKVEKFSPSGRPVSGKPIIDASGTADGIGIDTSSNDVYVANANHIEHYNSSGELVGTINAATMENTLGLGIDPVTHILFGSDDSLGLVNVFEPVGIPGINIISTTSESSNSATLHALIQPSENEQVTSCRFEYGTNVSYGLGAIPCSPAPPFSTSTEVNAGLSGLTPETTYHYRVIATGANGTSESSDHTYTPHQVVGIETGAPTAVKGTTATIHGSFVGSEEATSYYFEWGTTSSYGKDTAPPPGDSVGSPKHGEVVPLSFGLEGLLPETTYHYRLVAKNQTGVSHGEDEEFTTTATEPLIEEFVADVRTDSAVLRARINPGAADTSYHFEYGIGQCSATPDPCSVIPSENVDIGSGSEYQSVASPQLGGLLAGTTYHYRVVATNEESPPGGTAGPEQSFTTFSFSARQEDNCPNAHAQQQTGASLLLDCRAYELVSAPNTNGYDVESNLANGQTPFSGYPEASGSTGPSRLLYGVHGGGIPGTGEPTNRGLDPYVATRTESGWSTDYVGIPADKTPSVVPFSSTLLEADAGLDTFAFGGPEICSPCFGPGHTEVGIPVHLPSGELVQGMEGQIPQTSALSEGYVAKHLSANGEHLVFGSASKFEPQGAEGEVSIYDRNLKTDETHLVSFKPGDGGVLTGPGIGELDISSNGTHILIGELADEAEGRKYWHLYMNFGDFPATTELAPNAADGVVYDGMSANGEEVFFSSEEHLTGEDPEHSGADIYMWSKKGEEEGEPLALISKGDNEGKDGEPGNTAFCDPTSNTKYVHWNARGAQATCGDLAIGGAGGVPSAGGGIYFLSPELLAGPSDGVQGAPNLYLARPGSAPKFVTTLESSANASLPPAEHAFRHAYGAFSRPSAVAITEAPGEEGDSYILSLNNRGSVTKLTAAGQAVASFAHEGTLSGSAGCPLGALDYGEELHAPTSIAVDNDPSSPSYGDLYVPLFRFGGANFVDEFGPEGTCRGQIEVPQKPTGVAVDPVNGNLFVSTYEAGVSSYKPTAFQEEEQLVKEEQEKGKELPPVSPALEFETIPEPTGIAVDSHGTVYVEDGQSPSERDEAAAYDGFTGAFIGVLELSREAAFGIAVDTGGTPITNPSYNHVYVNEGDREGSLGNQVVEYEPTVGTELGAMEDGSIGFGRLARLEGESGSSGLAASAGRLLVSQAESGEVLEFGPRAIPSDPETDNPLVLESVASPESRHTADFQVTPSGNFAAFTSTLPLTGVNSASHREIFRYDASTEALTCVSCSPTGEQATGESTLASNGLSLADDGRVFFNSSEGLVDRDLNEREDVYEWEPDGAGPPRARCENAAGCLGLITPGTSPFNSSLLSASADGTDAFFFTRDALVHGDENGSRVRIYDAREEGGFPFTPSPVPCKASDECHGAGSPLPEPPNIQSVGSSPGGNERSPLTTVNSCKKGFILRHGHCAKRSKPHRHHGRRTHPRHGGRR